MDTRPAQPDHPTTRTGWPERLAGALTILLGLANATFAVLGFATDLVRFSPATSGSLLVLGLATIAIGVLVWRGSKAAITLALVVFGLLLVVGVIELVQTEGAVAGVATRTAILAVLVASLAVARTRVGSDPAR